MNPSLTNTICAIATAPGGAIGVVRMSGPEAIPIACRICKNIKATTPSRKAILSPILSSDTEGGEQYLDEAVVTLFRAPHSYTGEDCVEFSCHGSSYILNKLLELLIREGARMARPGEYTQRAFLNGKMDLSQAEAVADLIESRNKATHQLAISQLRGGISNELSRLREQLLHLTSLLELELDFSDHEDLEFADRGELLILAKNIDSHLNKLVRSFETGRALKQGIPVAIAGKTNVGKSTLLNHLLKDERAIVSDVHGTTRDTIEDVMEIHGVQFRFIDTAGFRQTTDAVEQIGIQRSLDAIEKARIVLWIIDQEPASEDIKEILQATKDKRLIIIQNKIDKNIDIRFPLPDLREHPRCTYIKIAAKHDRHIDQLEEAIYEAADLNTFSEQDIVVTNVRHYEAFIKAEECIQRVLKGMDERLSGDLLAEELRMTLNYLGEITGGAITPDEVLGNIFKNFCVGK
ncbi:MAG: tRNA uridine-5-carboxymethylaminomethyl(34) synthesis GTPase MnmE [Bacteroidales bacterium]|nr:tRNA uridine-5-carboxymethylaminomethyl(34) synthesis GTPase MnmE [Bacteroidales bacterium]